MESPFSTARPPTPAAHLADESPRLCLATELAWRWHGAQTRKGKPISYLSHLLQVQGLVIEHGGDGDQAIAALLHDSLEDAPSPAERAGREATIDSRFGASVLRMVLDCTDTTPDEAGPEKSPWRPRKERFLTRLETADPRSHLVAACDKRHNLADLIGDLEQEGRRTFERFHAGGPEQLWYFSTLSDVLAPRVPARLSRELEALVERLRTFVTESGP